MTDIRCLCDANIWIDACHGDLEKIYLDYFKMVGFAEQVHNEIIKFKSRTDEFVYIYDKYIESENYYTVVKTNSLGKIETQFKNQLRLAGFSDLDNSNKKIKSLGEYVSLYLAYYLKIPYIHTTDLDFIHKEKERLPDIQLYTWNEINGLISKDDDERLARNKEIERKKQLMNRNDIKQKENKQIESKICKMKTYINSQRNK
ncbi:hypothetical protein [Staphylococcus pettenkoferi]|uniref:hypothetical protein n=1 Tax=Staphylococcus pettenkoferi TaxID=170573 RepID=UPI00066E29BE|nr:hypothetical protein [Staphylococcus pettenkoferi]